MDGLVWIWVDSSSRLRWGRVLLRRSRSLRRRRSCWYSRHFWLFSRHSLNLFRLVDRRKRCCTPLSSFRCFAWFRMASCCWWWVWMGPVRRGYRIGLMSLGRHWARIWLDSLLFRFRQCFICRRTWTKGRNFLCWRWGSRFWRRRCRSRGRCWGWRVCRWWWHLVFVGRFNRGVGLWRWCLFWRIRSTCRGKLTTGWLVPTIVWNISFERMIRYWL